jgi:hypothetical protein
VECTKEPAAYVPMTLMVYIPAGVPLLPPGLLLLPPQASWKTKPANSMQASAAVVSFPFLLFRSEPRPTRVATNPISGRQSA